jgi:hypothetical protein
MNILEVIQTVDQMQTDGIIDSYAIGGAVGATFYLEPISTLDVDIFVTFQSEPGSLVISPQRIFDYLKTRGGRMEGEYVVIAGWPVQFLPPSNPLVEEALAEALTIPIGEMNAQVFSAEYLAAIALQVGRAKDKARVLQFLESGALDVERFQSILSRHQLIGAWEIFQRQFLSDTP